MLVFSWFLVQKKTTGSVNSDFIQRILLSDFHTYYSCSSVFLSPVKIIEKVGLPALIVMLLKSGNFQQSLVVRKEICSQQKNFIVVNKQKGCRKFLYELKRNPLRKCLFFAKIHSNASQTIYLLFY